MKRQDIQDFGVDRTDKKIIKGEDQVIKIRIKGDGSQKDQSIYYSVEHFDTDNRETYTRDLSKLLQLETSKTKKLKTDVKQLSKQINACNITISKIKQACTDNKMSYEQMLSKVTHLIYQHE